MSGNADLQDAFGRTIRYVRLSVTDRCDLRCSYCLPKGFKDYSEPDHWLDFDEICRVAAAFARLGTRRFRLTGGEPLLRRDLVGLVGRLAALPGVEDLSLSTNATRLARFAAPLKAAGLDRVNVSLDSLDRDCMTGITGRDSLPAILDGIMAAQAAGLSPVKLNMVVMAGVNAHEVVRLARFAIGHGFVLRLIETMPMGDTGRAAAHVPLDALRDELVGLFGLVPSAAELGGGPARYWQTPDGSASIGFITPLSRHFCATCNRVRLSASGTLYPCLGQDNKVELRPLLRGGCSDAELDAALRAAILDKPERHHFNERPAQILRFMSQTGG